MASKALMQVADLAAVEKGGGAPTQVAKAIIADFSALDKMNIDGSNKITLKTPT